MNKVILAMIGFKILPGECIRFLDGMLPLRINASECLTTSDPA
jgi:hypothetical protein